MNLSVLFYISTFPAYIIIYFCSPDVCNMYIKCYTCKFTRYVSILTKTSYTQKENGHDARDLSLFLNTSK